MTHSPALPFRPISLTQSVVEREWLVTNGIGGYAAGAIQIPLTRRYHGLLVAALPPPFGRTILLNDLTEQIIAPSQVQLSGWSPADAQSSFSKTFHLEGGLPVWTYSTAEWSLQKTIRMPHLQNTVHVTYQLLKGDSNLELCLKPLFHFRHHEAQVDRTLQSPYPVGLYGSHIQVQSADLALTTQLGIHGKQMEFVSNGGEFHDTFYSHEQERGYEAYDRLWSPGSFNVALKAGESVTLMASAESWDSIQALKPERVVQSENERRRHLLSQARVTDPEACELVLAADQFLISPRMRTNDQAKLEALGEDPRSVIAGYHWFTDWGRDTMISLEGLTLATGRYSEARAILSTFRQYIRDGLIPNMFPDGQNEGLYHTADATLWFFHAVDRYITISGDLASRDFFLSSLLDILSHHIRGTRFGIGLDPRDGLLTQGAPHYQLTWMDAKAGDWVVTPRRGKAVEINSLWYNAVCLTRDWLKAEQLPDTLGLGELSERIFESFNQRFWNPETGCLYDVVDGEQGDDASIRPNQVLSFALRYPVLKSEHQKPVLTQVEKHLLTPYGLRTLAPGARDYKPTYEGNLRSRDAAYHQGTVWPWLIGPFTDAFLRLYPDRKEVARKRLSSLVNHLTEAGVGSISEIFDAEPPYLPRGCPAQAWSVAETLRCWCNTR